MHDQVLDLDIGNTFVKWRFGDSYGRLPTLTLKAADLLSVCQAPPDRVRIGSVASAEQVERLIKEIRLHWGLTPEVAATTKNAAGVINSYAVPEAMGVDRWLAMLAAYNEFQRPCCVVDCGSAITVDYVDGQGVHLGGYIMPGPLLLRAGLLSNTERIHVNEDGDDWRHHGPGNNTSAAVNQGLNLMLTAVVKEIGAVYRDQLGEQAVLVLCGGDADHFQRILGQGVLRPQLVLDGLKYALP